MSRRTATCRATAVLVLVTCGCVVTGDAGALTTSTTDVSTTSSDESETGGASTSDAIKLDIGVADIETS